MTPIIFIVGLIVSMHVVGFIAMLIREWWVFRKAKKFKKSNNEAMYQLHSKEEWDASNKRVEARDQLIKILSKATINQGEGNYEFTILKAYAIARKKELDSYLDLCNTISNEPEADCTQDLKDIYGFGVAGLLDYVCAKEVGKVHQDELPETPVVPDPDEPKKEVNENSKNTKPTEENTEATSVSNW